MNNLLARRQTFRLPQRGFTLVELMIALVLGLLIIGGAIGVFLSNKQAYVSNNGLSDVQNSVRIAFELMASDMRAAGLTGCGASTRVANILKNGPNSSATQAWYANFGNAVMGYDNTSTIGDPALTGLTSGTPVTGQSSIQLIGADNPIASMLVDNESAGTFTINSIATTPAAGDLIIVCSPDHAAITQVSSYTATSFTVTHTATPASGAISPGNCTGGLGYPTNCDGSTGNITPIFTPNSLISPLHATDWYIGTNPQGGKSLYRLFVITVNSSGTFTATPTAQEMVRNVTSLALTYHIAGAASFVSAASVSASAANWGLIDAVQMVVKFQGSDLYAGTDSAPITRTIQSTVNLRNRVN